MPLHNLLRSRLSGYWASQKAAASSRISSGGSLVRSLLFSAKPICMLIDSAMNRLRSRRSEVQTVTHSQSKDTLSRL